MIVEMLPISPNDFAGCSKIQMDIYTMKWFGGTYEDIEMKYNLYPQSVLNCLKRTALRLQWLPRNEGGADPYLSPADELILLDIIKERENNYNNFTPSEILNAAFNLRCERYVKGSQELQEMKCKKLSNTLFKELAISSPPSRTWVNNFAQRYGLLILKGRVNE